MSAQTDLIYGRHAVAELLAARPDAILRLHLAADDGPMAAQARAAGVAVSRTPRHQLDAMAGADAVHQGAVAEVRAHAYVPLMDLLGPGPIVTQGPDAPLLVCLDQVQDPHNLGALMRSALALGAGGIIIGQDRCAQLTPAAVKAAAGAAARLPVARVVNISRALGQLREAGLWTVGTAPEGPQLLHQVDFRLPTVLVIGSEGPGMRPGVKKQCDVLARIPIQTLGSLNASVAGGIALYEAARQRQI